jgi:very-short-patch-repair endonuclease
MPRPIKLSDLDDTNARYLSGVSINQLSKEIGVSRGALSRCLARAGVRLRNHSDAETAKWAAIHSSPDRDAIIKKQCGRAWDAVRGSTKTEETVIKTAIAMAGRVRGRGGKHETDVALLVNSRGVPITWQHQLGRYNLDLAVRSGRIAVEVQRQYIVPKNAEQFRKRVEYILSEGWHLLYVFCPPTHRYCGKTPIPGTMRERFNGGKVADKIVAFTNLVRGLPSGRGQYGVISGYGKPSPSLCGHFNGETRVAGF